VNANTPGNVCSCTPHVYIRRRVSEGITEYLRSHVRHFPVAIARVAQEDTLKGKDMSFAEKIVHLRQKRKLTQKELAKIIGVHFSHMSRYERGISLPSVEVVKKISQVFNVSTDYLLFDDGNAPVQEKITDPELLQQFEQISQMTEREKAAIKIVLEGMVVKHQIEQIMAATPSLPLPEDGMPAGEYLATRHN
jgi:transcriptional regulator with XRE-family HTH domain